MVWPISEAFGGFVFRVQPRRNGPGWYAEAKRAAQPFEADNALDEPFDHDVWFEFADTPEAAIAKIKREVLN